MRALTTLRELEVALRPVQLHPTLPAPTTGSALAQNGPLLPFWGLLGPPEGAKAHTVRKVQFMACQRRIERIAHESSPSVHAQGPAWFKQQRVLLPKTRSERIDGVVHQGSDTQQSSRSARSAVYKARPSQAKCASARHYNRSRRSCPITRNANSCWGAIVGTTNRSIDAIPSM